MGVLCRPAHTVPYYGKIGKEKLLIRLEQLSIDGVEE